MKKILALLMTVAMIGSLTACGGNADTQNSVISKKGNNEVFFKIIGL